MMRPRKARPRKARPRKARLRKARSSGMAKVRLSHFKVINILRKFLAHIFLSRK